MSRRTIPLLVGLIILVIAIAVRLRILNHDLSLDEVWSLRLSTLLWSPLDVFSLHTDNNHYLNTLWFWLIGIHQPFWLYRLPSFLCGVGLLAVVMRQEWKRSPLAGATVGLLLALSPYFTSASAEGRGYMPMIFFGYLGFLAMQRLLQKDTLQDALLVALCVMIALLWQLMGILLFIALVIWFIAAKQTHMTERTMISFFVAFLPVTVLLFLLGITDLSHLTLGGAPASTPLDAAQEAVMGLCGIATTHPLSVPVVIALTIALIVLIEQRAQKHAAEGWFLVTLFLIAPLLWAVAIHPSFFYARYFAPLLLWTIILVGGAISDAMLSKKKAAVRASMLLFSLTLASSTLAQGPLDDTPHPYSGTLALLDRIVAPGTITIGSHFDFRTDLLLWYYAPRMAPSRIFLMLPKAARTTHLAEIWLADLDLETPQMTLEENGAIYDTLQPFLPKGAKWMPLKLEADAKTR